jgi:hypothetical protein
MENEKAHLRVRFVLYKLNSISVILLNISLHP